MSIFRSRWVQKAINTLVLGGNRRVVMRHFINVMYHLKLDVRSEPILAVFEALELGLVPLLIFKRIRGRRIFVFAKLVPLWRQYAKVIQWLRTAVRLTKARVGIDSRLLNEVQLLLAGNYKSNVFRRRLSIYQLMVDARLHSHFRWK